jgi:hypothetical protein
MGKDQATSATQIGAADLRGINRVAARLLRANEKVWRLVRSDRERGEHWNTKTASIQVNEFAFLFQPKRRFLPGLFGPHFWTMSCVSIHIVGVNGHQSSLVWSLPKGSNIGQHRIWADCRKGLPEVKQQLNQLRLSMLAFANLERVHPTEVTGTPYLLASASELASQRATHLTGTPQTRDRIEHWG